MWQWWRVLLTVRRFVSCVGCGRRQHQICVQHLDQIWTSGYLCDHCLRTNTHSRPANLYVAESELWRRVICTIFNGSETSKCGETSRSVMCKGCKMFKGQKVQERQKLWGVKNWVFLCGVNCKARRTWWNKTEIKQSNCFSLISIFFNTAKLFQCFTFSDVRTSEIKLQLNNAAGGRLYFTRPHIPETDTSWNWIKQNCRRSAETKPRPSAVLFYFSFISPCATRYLLEFWSPGGFAYPSVRCWCCQLRCNCFHH